MERSCPDCGGVLVDRIVSGLCPHCVAGRVRENRIASTPAEVTLPNGYEFIMELGRGGMGVVYLAHQRALGRYVALKQLGVAWRQHPRARERFLREARTAARLEHPGIVRVWETARPDEAIPWYTQEFLEGGDLAELLRERGPLRWRDAVALIATVADAVEAAHRAGVIHRDLKPSNILLDAEGRPKVGDFGLAWMTGQEIAELTATGEILGTPAYLAPECLAGKTGDAAAAPADVYALGAVLFHVVAGRLPFAAEHPLQQLAAASREAAPRLDGVPGLDPIPPRLADACSRCLERDPARRFRSAGEFARELRAILAPNGLRVRPWRPGGRQSRRMWVGAVAIVMSAVVAGVMFLRPKSPPDAAPPAAIGVATLPLAVLPAEAEPGDETIAWLAGGLPDEIVASLLRVSDLTVIGAVSTRAAVVQMADPRELRRLTGAGAIVSTRIQRWQDQVRVSAQLVDTATGNVLWSRTYDRRESNLLNLQSDIATDLAIKLAGRVRPQAADTSRGTHSTVPEAQRLLVQARALVRDASAASDQVRAAADMLKQALQLDPQLALAHATLAEVHLLHYHWGVERTDARLALAFNAAQAALRINPDLPEAEIALGNYYYRGSKDYVTARPHFERARALSPHKSEAIEGLGYLLRRLGDFEAAAVQLREALRVDPLNPILAYNVADTELRRGNFAVANATLEESLRLMPGHVALRKLKGDLYAAWHGDLQPMLEELAVRSSQLPTPELYVLDRVEAELLGGRVENALEVLRGSTFSLLEAQSVYLTRAGYEALLLRFAGRHDEAAVSARGVLPAVEAELARRPNDPRVLLHAAQLRALAGDMAEAVARFERTLTPGDLAAVDAFDRGYYLRCGAILFASCGDLLRAKHLLAELERTPSQYPAALLRLHPALRPILGEEV